MANTRNKVAIVFDGVVLPQSRVFAGTAVIRYTKYNLLQENCQMVFSMPL
ncbi:MAG: hypothetical protein FWH14_02750 [Oscillospiraceae bacterium]|nr:hypothetical protein [Oscillospiraceae bacterium]